MAPDEMARRDRDSIAEDVEPWRDSTVADRVRAVRGLLRLASASLAGDDELSAARREWQDPRSPESMELWLRLVSRSRHDADDW